MAIGEFYPVPEIDLRTATHGVFGSCICARRLMEKTSWVGEQLGDLAGRRPEELPPCFLAVQEDALSPRIGWMTEYGWWEPKESFSDLGFLRSCIDPFVGPYPKPTIPPIPVSQWSTTTLVFRPKDGSKSDLAMTLYNEMSWKNNNYFLEEDMTLCRVFRVPKVKRKCVVYRDPCQPQFGYAADPVHEFHKLDFDLDVADIPDFDLPELPDFDAESNGVGGWDWLLADNLIYDTHAMRRIREKGGWDLPSIDSSGGPKKRPRSKPVGKSEAWQSFIKIYTKDPEVVYAACRYCGRMMKLKGGSKCGTKSLSRHNETCPCKPGSSVDTLH